MNSNYVASLLVGIEVGVVIGAVTMVIFFLSFEKEVQQKKNLFDKFGAFVFIVAQLVSVAVLYLIYIKYEIGYSKLFNLIIFILITILTNYLSYKHINTVITHISYSFKSLVSLFLNVVFLLAVACLYLYITAYGDPNITAHPITSTLLSICGICLTFLIAVLQLKDQE